MFKVHLFIWFEVGRSMFDVGSSSFPGSMFDVYLFLGSMFGFTLRPFALKLLQFFE